MVQKEGRTLSSLMQRATKKMQSMISSLDRKAEESMPSFPSNEHLSVLPELLDDDLGTGLHFSIVDSERTDPQLKCKFSTKNSNQLSLTGNRN